MPLTPFHLGPGLFFGMLFRRFSNIWAFLAGSVLMDLEPLLWIFIKRCYFCPHHGFFHTILGAVVGSIGVALLLKIFAKPLERFSLKLKIKQTFSFAVLYLSSLAGWLLHIFFDCFLHGDVYPLWPSHYNPLLVGPKIFWQLQLILFGLGIIGLVLAYRYYKKLNRKS